MHAAVRCSLSLLLGVGNGYEGNTTAPAGHGVHVRVVELANWSFLASIRILCGACRGGTGKILNSSMEYVV